MRTLFCLTVILLSAIPLSRAEKPPASINEHYRWCLLPKSRSDAIARLEGFYKQRHPKDEEYEDSAQIRFVRMSAYRLAELYGAEGNLEKMRFYLRWLEKTDGDIK